MPSKPRSSLFDDFQRRGQGGCHLTGVAPPQSCRSASAGFSPKAEILKATSERSLARSTFSAELVRTSDQAAIAFRHASNTSRCFATGNAAKASVAVNQRASAISSAWSASGASCRRRTRNIAAS